MPRIAAGHDYILRLELDKILKMEFQPVFMSGRSLGKAYKSFWQNKIRPSIVPREAPICSVCGFKAEERRLIHADEVWRFPGPPRAVLSEIRPLCVYCHEAKDYGNLLLRIQRGVAAARLAGIVQEHYCKINACTSEEFSEDYKIALEAKENLEKLYGVNCAVEIDYGKWTPPPRPAGLPKLSHSQRNTVRSLYKGEEPGELDRDGKPISWVSGEREEPIVVRDRELSSFGAAVRFLQSLPLKERDAVIEEMKQYIESEDDYDDESWIVEHNEALEPWLRGMYPFSG
jgi:hypothetical protein